MWECKRAVKKIEISMILLWQYFIESWQNINYDTEQGL